MKAKLTKTITAIFLFAIPVSGFGQTAPELNTAADFAILAGTGISFAPPKSKITNMDVGLHPGVLTSITGLENLTHINGVILAENYDPEIRLVDAKQHLVDAYDEAVNAASGATISGNQGGGAPLPPGVYTSGESISIEGDALTLEGDENAVWIFQIGSTLTTTAGGNVILAGGAQAKNVYWQVGTSATIGEYTDFKGNILAYTSISIGVGATIDGRALARDGAVTFAGGGTMTNPDPDDEPADLTITKTADPQTFSKVGDEIKYEIVVTNNGAQDLENIIVKDVLTGLDEEISLAPEEIATFTTTYTITQDEMDDGFFANTATAEVTAEAFIVSTNEIVLRVAPPPPIPLFTWALVLAGILIAGFVVFQYRRSTPEKV